MTETLSFPKLGWEFHLSRVAFSIGGIQIRWYGILFAAALLVCMYYIFKRLHQFGLDEDRVIDVVMGAVLGGVVGARLYYVIFSGDTYFREDPLAILRIWEGGIAMYGSIIGGLLAGWLVCRWRKVKLLPMVDLGLSAVMLGQAIGRWGNFVNMEAFGTNTDGWWGMTSPSIQWYLAQNQSALEAIGVTVDPMMPVHPTFFYESAWCLIGFILLAWYTSRRRYDGELTLIYLCWYGLGRFFIEGLRTDSLMMGNVRISQLVAILCVAGSILVMGAIRSRIRRANDPGYLPLYVNTEEGKAVIAGTFYPKKEKRGKGAEGEADAGASGEDTPLEEPAGEAGGSSDAEDSSGDGGDDLGEDTVEEQNEDEDEDGEERGADGEDH